MVISRNGLGMSHHAVVLLVSAAARFVISQSIVIADGATIAG